MQAHPQTIEVMQKLGAHSKSFKKTVCVTDPYRGQAWKVRIRYFLLRKRMYLMKPKNLIAYLLY